MCMYIYTQHHKTCHRDIAAVSSSWVYAYWGARNIYDYVYLCIYNIILKISSSKQLLGICLLGAIASLNKKTLTLI